MKKTLLAILRKPFNFVVAAVKQAKENPLFTILAIIVLFKGVETALLQAILVCTICILLCVVPAAIKKMFKKAANLIAKPFVALKNVLNRATEETEITL